MMNLSSLSRACTISCLGFACLVIVTALGFAWVGVGVMGVCVFGSFYCVKKAQSTINFITHTCHQLRKGDFEARLIHTSGQSELTNLMNAVNDTLMFVNRRRLWNM